MKKTNIFNNIITNFSPVVEELIRNICTDLDNEDKIDEMLEKYLYNDKIKTLRNLVKKKNKSIRKKTSYSMFLAHNNIRKNNNNKLTLKEYNILKGEYWKNITLEEKNKYQKLADQWNMENMPYKMGKINQLKKKEKKKEENQEIESLFDNNVVSSYQQVIVEI
jgi:hypothetical protein